MAIYIDDQKFSYEEAIKHLGVRDSIPFKDNKRKTFRLTRITQDKENGGLRVKKSINTVPQFVVLVPYLGTYVTIRFATQQIKQKNEAVKYLPSLIYLTPDEEGQMYVPDNLEFLFWFLHPKHKLSPFHDPKGASNYEFVDRDGEAKKELQKDEVLISCLSILVGDNAWHIFKLRKFAKGIRMNNVDDYGDNELINQLRKRVYADPLGFYNLIHSRTAHFDGLITDAIDKKILVLKELHGLKRWYLNSEEILPVTYGADAKQQLYDHIANNSQVLLPIINDSLTKTERSDVLKHANVDSLLGMSEEVKAPNEALQNVQNNDVGYRITAFMKVDSDGEYRKRIQENLDLLEEKGEKLHHSKKIWLEDNKEAVEYYKEKYVNVKV